mgnify:CR=1 FL=1
MPETQIRVCRGCGASAAHRTFETREMMFGFRDRFWYFECASCGSLQICDVPSNLGKYYPSNYYSLGMPSGVKRALQAAWAEYSYSGRNLLGWMIGRVLGKHQGVASIARLGLPKNARILDVGCGAGDLLLQLSHLGFTNLTGIDPFLEKDVAYPCGLRVFKQFIAQASGEFDLVMFNHSLEHVPEPKADLASASRLLARNGLLVVGIPVAGSYAWRTYGPDWVALDPPRHLYVPTPAAMKAMAESLGLACESVVFESDEFMLWGSEQYKADIPLQDPRSYAHNRLRRLLPGPRMRQLKAKAAALNRSGDSDAARFCFRKRG